MKKFVRFCVSSFAFCVLGSLLAFGQGSAGPVAGGTNYSNLSSAFSDPSVSWAATGLTLNYTAGTVWQNGSGAAITAGTVTLTTSLSTCTQAGIQAGSCNIIYWPGSGASLSATSTYATAAAPGNRILYYCTTNSSGNITACAPTELDINGSTPTTYADGAFFVQPANCFLTAGTTAFTTGPTLVRAAANNIVLSGTTNTTAGTIAATCDITFAGRTTSGLGFQATAVSLLYGIQTTNLSSIAAATVSTVAYPAAGGTASGTVGSVGGTYTVTPATLQTATTTAGQCYNEKVAFGTPFTFTDKTKISFDQVFTTAGSTATTFQVCGLIVYGNWIQ
jgi:hypothetical protein